MASSLARLISPIVAAAVFLLMLVRVIYFYLAPDASLIGVVPDDAFYYLQLAKHRVNDGFWTFDGTAPATGFHFLYGYFLVFLYSTFGDIDWRQLYLLIGVLASLSIAMAAYFTSRSAEIVLDRKVIPIAIAPFFTTPAMIQSTVMMESWMVLLFSSLTIYALAQDKKPSLYGAIGLVTLGILGSLARTDYGMLPGVLFCVFFVAHQWLNNNLLKRSSFVLLGAIIGVLIVLLQNYHISGHFSQASAQTKFYWSSVSGHNILTPVSLVFSIVLPFYTEIGKPAKVVMLLALALSLLWSLKFPLRMARKKENLHALALFMGGLITLFGYIMFYKHNSAALLTWYSSNLIVPIGIVLASTVFFVFREKAYLPAVLGLAVYMSSGLVNMFTVYWPHAAGMMQAGLFVKDQRAQDVYAAWNAGIISYFSGKNLINIDGLTNDEVLPYIKTNTLFDYIRIRKINYLVDYERMLNDMSLRKRGGYADERIDRCIRPLQAVDGDFKSWAGSRLRVFEVTPGCH